jgi:hypothetical protein
MISNEKDESFEKKDIFSGEKKNCDKNLFLRYIEKYQL